MCFRSSNKTILEMNILVTISTLLTYFSIMADKFTVLSFLEALEDSVCSTLGPDEDMPDDRNSKSQS